MSRTVLIVVALLLLSLGVSVYAQDDDISLGDLARAARSAKASSDQNVIDNDNLKVAMDQAESARLNGKPVFSIDPSGTSSGDHGGLKAPRIRDDPLARFLFSASVTGERHVIGRNSQGIGESEG